MRELSLHIIDLVENALVAGAKRVLVRVEQDKQRDTLRIAVDDDGPGWAVSQATACDPFHSTKAGARTGMGLPLLEAAARRAGGQLLLGRSKLGGACASATFRLSDVDRSPLGDLAQSLAALAYVEPGVAIACEISVDGRTVRASSGVAGDRSAAGWEKYGRMRERIAEGMCQLGATQ